MIDSYSWRYLKKPMLFIDSMGFLRAAIWETSSNVGWKPAISAQLNYRYQTSYRLVLSKGGHCFRELNKSEDLFFFIFYKL